MDRRLRHRRPPSGRVDWNTYVASLFPLAWWQLDDDDNPPDNSLISDASGNGNTGTFNGDSTFPDRRTAALISGSAFGITTDAGSNLRGTHVGTLCNGNSFTFGCWIRGTGTAAANFVRQSSGYTGLSVMLNYNAGASSGAMMFYFDTGGADANALGVSSTGWNDGGVHLVFFEYDKNADRQAIWFDGAKIADRARAGTKPTLGTNLHDFAFRVASNLADIEVDEYLFFTRVLTSGEHATLASYG